MRTRATPHHPRQHSSDCIQSIALPPRHTCVFVCCPSLLFLSRPSLLLSCSSAWRAHRMRRSPFATLVSCFRNPAATIGRRRRHRHKPGPRVPRWQARKMGQEESRPVDASVPPRTLSARSLEAVAEHIKEGKCDRIVVLTGAGISTAAGSRSFHPDAS